MLPVTLTQIPSVPYRSQQASHYFVLSHAWDQHRHIMCGQTTDAAPRVACAATVASAPFRFNRIGSGISHEDLFDA